MKYILVQGAAGFVAHYLLSRLVNGGYRYFILVDIKPIPGNILSYIKNIDAHVVTYEYSSLLNLPINLEYDIAISLAGLTDVDIGLVHPKDAFNANINIAIELGEWLRKSNPQTRLIYMSSDEVLGESFVPLPEDAPLRPTQPYAASKAAAEVVLHNYRDVYKLNIVTVRSCNLVGGYQRARKLIPVTVKNLLLSKPVPIYGNGEHMREWMSVNDLCEAIVGLMNSSVPCGVYQAASGTHLSVMEVVEIVSKAIGLPLKTRQVNGRLIHDKCYAMMTTRLQSVGWQPKIDPRQAIAQAAHEMANLAFLNEFPFLE